MLVGGAREVNRKGMSLFKRAKEVSWRGRGRGYCDGDAGEGVMGRQALE